jgi:AraC-like DNA-binding protein
VNDDRDRGGSPTDDYREFRPRPPLSEFLVCLWAKTIRSASESLQRVLPDACVDIVVIDGTPFLVGPCTEPILIFVPPGSTIVGARFHPGCGPCLTGTPVSELSNREVALSEIVGSSMAACFEQLAGIATIAGRLRAMEEILTGRVCRTGSPDFLVRAAVRWIAEHPEEGVDALSHHLGMSHRQVRRRFVAAVGYGPGMFHSVLRFQRLLKRACGAPVRGHLAQFAADVHYYDQAHMSREVRRFSGAAPGILLQSSLCSLQLSGLV